MPLGTLIANATAFDKLKEEFTHAPLLTHWVPDSQIVVETDTSDYALAAILSIHSSDGEIHPITFHSRSFNPAELNYDTHNKELLTIFEAFKHWHQYLEGSGTLVDVVITKTWSTSLLQSYLLGVKLNGPNSFPSST
jgi:hypothetical protein